MGDASRGSTWAALGWPRFQKRLIGSARGRRNLKSVPGQDVVVECPQTLYGDGQDPQPTQGLFTGTVQSLGSIQDGMLPTVLQLDEAPLPGSHYLGLHCTVPTHMTASSVCPNSPCS